jgi:diguanylate cyclase (GGDEF)-like protein/PAS domain S-box-containing protein
MPASKYRFSIVTRVFGLIAATLLLVGAGEIVSGVNLRADRQGEVRDDAMQLARIASLHMARILEGAHDVLATLGKLPEGSRWDARACAVVAATVNDSFEFDHVAAADLHGKDLCSSGGITMLGVTIPDRELFDRVLATREFAVGSYGTGLLSGSELLRVAHPIVDDKDTVAGVLYAGINVTWLNTAIDQWKLPKGTTLDIADRNGVIVARYPDSSSVGRSLPDSLKRFLRARDPGTIETAGMDGVMRLYGYVPSETNALAVFVGLDPHPAFSERIDRTIWINFSVILVVLAASGVFAWTYVRRSIARPLERLLTAATAWRAGDWMVRTGDATGISEFDRLATAFDGMAAAVVARDESLSYRDSILHAISNSAAELVQAGGLGEVIPRILKAVGEAMRADRILVLETSASAPSEVLSHVWHGPNSPVDVTAAYFADLPAKARGDIEAWSQPLRLGKVVATSREDAVGFVKKIFEDLGIVSTLQAPVVVDGKFWGQIVIDDCKSQRSWTSTEIDALKVLADLIGASIARQRHLEKLSNADDVVRSSPAILYRIGIKAGSPVLSYVSENVGLLGYNAAALIADPALYLSMIHPDDRVVTRAVLASVLDGGAGGTFEVRIATTGGVYRWMENRYTPTRDARGQLIHVAGVLTDITERKKVEEQLRFANTVLKTQSETSPDGILVVDSNQRILSFNQRFIDLWGVPKELASAAAARGADEPVLATVVSRVKDPEAFIARVQHLYAHPGESSFDELQTTDGRFIDRHTSALRTPDGVDLGRIWFFRDVTAAKKAQQELIESEIRFRTVLQATGDGILVVDLATGRPVLGNQAICKMLGYRLDELIGIDADRIYPDELVVERRRIRARVGAGEDVLTANVRLKRKDGSEFTSDIFASHMTLAGHTYLVGMFHDVTERNRTETALVRERDFSTAIVDSLPGLFFVVNSAGHLVRYNKGLELIPRAPSKLQGMDILVNVVAADQELAASKIREALVQGHAETEIGVIGKDGATRRYLISVAKIELDDGPGILGVGMDVTEIRQMERQLQASEQRFRTIFSSVSDGILLRDVETAKVVEVNQSACEMFGYSRDELLGSTVDKLSSGVAPYTAAAAVQRFAKVRTGATETFEWSSRTKGGRIFNTDVTLQEVTFGDHDYLLSTIRDITERKRNEAQIMQMARHDSLTGLPNRRVFAEAVQQAIARAHRGGKGFAVIYLDLDHFKDINDTLGHPAGDALLKQVGARLKAGVRDMDTVARFGGDEFAVLEAEITDPTDAGVLAAKLLQVLAEPYSFGGNEIRSGASFGIAVYGRDAEDAETLLSRADAAPTGSSPRQWIPKSAPVSRSATNCGPPSGPASSSSNISRRSRSAPAASSASKPSPAGGTPRAASSRRTISFPRRRRTD